MKRFDETKQIEEQINQTLTSSWLASLDQRADASRFPTLLKLAAWARGIQGPNDIGDLAHHQNYRQQREGFFQPLLLRKMIQPGVTLKFDGQKIITLRRKQFCSPRKGQKQKADHPKRVLERILGHAPKTKDFKAIADNISLDKVEQTCPLSFKPFYNAFRHEDLSK
jgi:hypothetical protein